MSETRRAFLTNVLAGAALARESARRIPIALVQFDAVPEQIDRNLQEVERLTRQAAGMGARWVMFHEGTLSDYTPRLSELAEPVPAGKCTRHLERVARELKCYISFGLSENNKGLYHITQVFVGPKGFFYKYRKTWLWRTPKDKGYRDESVRYDPGSGPELFVIDGVKATCFICADGGSERCIQRATDLHPEVVFFPNNRGVLPRFEDFGALAKRIHAPMLVTNRVGMSWVAAAKGGCTVFSADGEVLAKANREGREEILTHTLEIA